MCVNVALSGLRHFCFVSPSVIIWHVYVSKTMMTVTTFMSQHMICHVLLAKKTNAYTWMTETCLPRATRTFTNCDMAIKSVLTTSKGTLMMGIMLNHFSVGLSDRLM